MGELSLKCEVFITKGILWLLPGHTRGCLPAAIFHTQQSASDQANCFVPMLSA